MVLQSLVHPNRTLEQLNKQRESKLFTDVTILVSGEKFSAHRALLAAHSPVFKSVLEDSSLTQENVPNINLDGVESSYFSVLLNFLYTSKLAINLTNVDQVSATSAFLQVSSVVDLCNKFKEANAKIECKSEAIYKDDISNGNDKEAFPEADYGRDQIEVEVTEEGHPPIQGDVDSTIALLTSQSQILPKYKKSFGSSKRGRKRAIRVMCPVCSKTMTQNRLAAHMRSHTGEKPVSCSICGSSFANIYNLKIHERKHTGERPHKCPTCGRSFADPSSLSKHKLWHAGVKKKKCGECGRMFSTASQVSEHMRTHTKERPFFCTDCGKTYSYKCDLTRHMREHTGELYGPCKYCGRLFSHCGNYKVHVKTHEKGKTERVKLGSEMFFVSGNYQNTITLTSQSTSDLDNPESAVVKTDDLAELMAHGHGLEVMINEGKLIVNEQLDKNGALKSDGEETIVMTQEEEMAAATASIEQSMNDNLISTEVINNDKDDTLVIVDQIMDTKFPPS